MGPSILHSLLQSGRPSQNVPLRRQADGDKMPQICCSSSSCVLFFKSIDVLFVEPHNRKPHGSRSFVPRHPNLQPVKMAVPEEEVHNVVMLHLA